MNTIDRVFSDPQVCEMLIGMEHRGPQGRWIAHEDSPKLLSTTEFLPLLGDHPQEILRNVLG